MSTPDIIIALTRLPHAQGLPLPAYETHGAAGMDLRAAVAEEAPEGLEDPALQFLVVLLVEDLQEVVDPHGDADHLLGVAPEVGGQPVILRVV